jgi:hypothetical protein
MELVKLLKCPCQACKAAGTEVDRSKHAPVNVLYRYSS